MNDFVFFPSPVSSSVFEVDDTRLWKTSIVVGGYDNALSIYSLGDQLHFQDFSKLTGYVKERVNGLLTKSVMSLYGMVGGKGKSHVNEDAARIENECKLVTSIVDFTDGKRRILRMSIEPGNSRYIASADSLGRVTLFDCQVQGIVRIWKGLRDARLAWTNDVQTEDVTGEETVGNNIQLCLAIYAPLLGLLSFYVMSHGPCIRVIPVGMHCQICTLLNSFGSVQCLLLRPEATSKKLEFVFVSPGETSDSDLDVRQAQLGVIDSDGGSSLQLSRKIVMTEELRTMTVGQFRKILSDLLEELVFAFHNVKSADSSALLDMCVATEDKILPLLAKIDNNNDLKEWVACYRLVECSELYGVVDAPHETYHTPPDKTADNFIVVSHIPLRLSPKLHRLLLSKISDSVAALTEENVEINSFAKLKLRNELAGVLKLLEGFEVLNAVCYSEDPNSDGKVCETFDDDNSFKASPLTSTSEDAAIICRQNTFRAEALCWNLRLSKKFDFVREKHRSSESPVNSSSRKSSSFELQRNIISPTNLEVLGSSLPNNSPHPIRHPSISPLDASTLKFAIRNISMYQCNFTQFRVFFGLHQSDLIDQSDVPTIGIKTADLQKCMRLDTAVESSTIYTRSTTKTVLSSTPTTPMEMDGELRGIDSFNVSCMKRQHKSVCPVYFTTIRFQSVFCWSCLMQIKNAIRDDNLLQMSGHNMLGTFGLSYGVVKLLAKPLLGESFALGRYLSGLKAINLQRAEISLVKVLPLFASFLELQKPSVIIGDLLAKRIATSPFQR